MFFKYKKGILNHNITNLKADKSSIAQRNGL